VGHLARGDQLGSRRQAGQGVPARLQRHHGLEQQLSLLLQRHLREQIRDPLRERAAGVLVGVQPSILVEIAIENAIVSPSGCAVQRRSFGPSS
jgi:hypothetical protein